MSYAHLIRVSLVGILAFAIVITLDSDSGVNVYDNPKFEIFMKTLTSHEPISIDNDTEFALQAVMKGGLATAHQKTLTSSKITV